MTLGQKIKRIRIFRGMTQKELGIKVGYGESSADVRIAQYEAGKRIPKRETILSMAEILKVNPSTFGCEDDRNGMELMQMFLWLEEENSSVISLFQMQQAKDQVGLWIENQEMNEFLQE